MIDSIEKVLRRHDLIEERLSIRITGCPNGCARPYAGDIGIVGRMPDYYALYVGGDFEGTRLNFKLLDKVHYDNIASTPGAAVRAVHARAARARRLRRFLSARGGAAAAGGTGAAGIRVECGRIMLPVSLDLARLRVVLVGDGPAGLHGDWRCCMRPAATKLTVYASRPNAEWLNAAGPLLVGDVPLAADFAGAAVVFLAGLDDALTIALASAARQAGALVHAEDRLDLTDLHIPAVVRRGDLTLAVSTNGESPGAGAAFEAPSRRAVRTRLEWPRARDRVLAAALAGTGLGPRRDCGAHRGSG